MGHEDFFEMQLIEFTFWEDGSEKTLVKYDGFESLPPHLKEDLDKNPFEIMLKGKHWKIVDINRNLRAHGKGMHVKIRLDLD